MPTAPSPPARYAALDGWRGVCAVLVVMYHFHTTSHVEQIALVRHAYLFVDFFFVLSGFVLTHAYGDRLYSVRDAGVMLWRRLGRLWPLHIATLAAFIALELSVPALSMLSGAQRSAATAFDPASSALLQAIPTNLLLLHGLGIHDRLTWNHPSWCISTEFWTYAIFALVLLLPSRWPAIAAVLLIAGSVFVLRHVSPSTVGVDHDFGIIRCIFGFFVGHMCYRLVKSTPARMPLPTLAELVALAALMLFVIKAGRTPFDLAAPLVFAAVVWVFAQENGMVSAVLRMQPFELLGRVSYSIYMVHALIIGVALRGATVLEQATGQSFTFMGPTGGGTARFISHGVAWTMDTLVAVYVLAVVGLARWTWGAIEMPCQHWWNGLAFTGSAPGESASAVRSPASA